MLTNLAMICPRILEPVRDERARRWTPENFRSAHLVGICGSGMTALAELLVGFGWRVTGSDLNRPGPAFERLIARGLRVHQGHEDRFLPTDADVLVYSPAVSLANPERRLAARLNIPQFSYTRMLGALMESRIGVCIAGTHGKSTTTAMTASILSDAGLQPSAVVGAELCGRNRSGFAGEGSLFVVESCEYQRNFLEYRPRYAAILGIEPDHFDCFHDLADLQDAFAAFAARVEKDGVLLVRGDCPVSQAAAREARAEIVTFAPTAHDGWWAADLRPAGNGTRFRIFRGEKYVTEIALPVPGRHNVMNALAAAALACHLGVRPRDVRDSLQEFRGIRRRFEVLGSWRGVTLVDDYAHHPTAIRATLQAARARFGRRRLWCAFQPHQVSRTEALMSEFATSFDEADEVLIAPVFAAREPGVTQPEFASERLTRAIAGRNVRARFFPSLDQLQATLEDESRPGDVVITMGAGDIDRVQHAFTRRIQRHHAPR